MQPRPMAETVRPWVPRGVVVSMAVGRKGERENGGIGQKWRGFGLTQGQLVSGYPFPVTIPRSPVLPFSRSPVPPFPRSPFTNMPILHVAITGRNRSHLTALGPKLRIVVVGYKETKSGITVDAYVRSEKVEWLRKQGYGGTPPEDVGPQDRGRG